MTGYGPTLPATGGGASVLALAWGISMHNWFVIGFAFIAIGITAYYFYRLRRGETKVSRKGW